MADPFGDLDAAFDDLDDMLGDLTASFGGDPADLNSGGVPDTSGLEDPFAGDASIPAATPKPAVVPVVAPVAAAPGGDPYARGFLPAASPPAQPKRPPVVARRTAAKPTARRPPAVARWGAVGGPKGAPGQGGRGPVPKRPPMPKRTGVARTNQPAGAARPKLPLGAVDPMRAPAVNNTPGGVGGAVTGARGPAAGKVPQGRPKVAARPKRAGMGGPKRGPNPKRMSVSRMQAINPMAMGGGGMGRRGPPPGGAGPKQPGGLDMTRAPAAATSMSTNDELSRCTCGAAFAGSTMHAEACPCYREPEPEPVAAPAPAAGGAGGDVGDAFDDLEAMMAGDDLFGDNAGSGAAAATGGAPSGGSAATAGGVKNSAAPAVSPRPAPTETSPTPAATPAAQPAAAPTPAAQSRPAATPVSTDNSNNSTPGGRKKTLGQRMPTFRKAVIDAPSFKKMGTDGAEGAVLKKTKLGWRKHFLQVSAGTLYKYTERPPSKPEGTVVLSTASITSDGAVFVVDGVQFKAANAMEAAQWVDALRGKTSSGGGGPTSQEDIERYKQEARERYEEQERQNQIVLEAKRERDRELAEQKAAQAAAQAAEPAQPVAAEPVAAAPVAQPVAEPVQPVVVPVTTPATVTPVAAPKAAPAARPARAFGANRPVGAQPSPFVTAGIDSTKDRAESDADLNGLASELEGLGLAEVAPAHQAPTPVAAPVAAPITVAPVVVPDVAQFMDNSPINVTIPVTQSLQPQIDQAEQLIAAAHQKAAGFETELATLRSALEGFDAQIEEAQQKKTEAAMSEEFKAAAEWKRRELALVEEKAASEHKLLEMQTANPHSEQIQRIEQQILDLKERESQRLAAEQLKRDELEAAERARRLEEARAKAAAEAARLQREAEAEAERQRQAAAAEAERQRQRAEEERIAREKAEQERIAREKAEQERIAQEQAAAAAKAQRISEIEAQIAALDQKKKECAMAEDYLGAGDAKKQQDALRAELESLQ